MGLYEMGHQMLIGYLASSIEYHAMAQAGIEHGARSAVINNRIHHIELLLQQYLEIVGVDRLPPKWIEEGATRQRISQYLINHCLDKDYHLQNKLLGPLQAANHDTFLHELRAQSVATAAAYHAGATKSAASIYITCPRTPNTTFTSEEFRILVLKRLNLTIRELHGVGHCVCHDPGDPPTIIDPQGNHLLNCKAGKRALGAAGPHAIGRHNRTLQVLRSIAALGSHSVILEPVGPSYQPVLNTRLPSGELAVGRCDILYADNMHHVGQMVLGDLSVTNPVTAEVIAAGFDHTGFDNLDTAPHISRRETVKINKYQVGVRALNKVFKPFIVDPFGNWSLIVEEFINQCCDTYGRRHPDLSIPMLKRFWKKELSGVIQKTSVEMLLHRVELARRRLEGIPIGGGIEFARGIGDLMRVDIAGGGDDFLEGGE